MKYPKSLCDNSKYSSGRPECETYTCFSMRFQQAPHGRINGFILSLLTFLWFFLAAGNAFALDSDSKQPIYIEANTATYDEKKGETVYTGDVKATQGSLEVQGDQMTVYQKGGQTEKVVVTGKPTRLKQTPEGGKEDIHGTSQRADYFPETGILILYDKALVWQGQNSTASDIIEYDTKNALFKAGSPSTGSKRVHVKMQPKEKSE
ncbi:lipopolysaccharide transport periplasmic protein LptA [Methylocaldum sp.]|uniref:lipopolysaccharide transport periplasmic protein LptA n=1 Tax=Methylocaldum sp. TaxID=1969727 RepID=UPI002D3BF5F7|nr:lipopolysaccharide transport periplasmic protein LptA [Methylocaldum sp.]HYE37902.1 lipopolysaccharide transport periplasmic protein LptA [Methylocaldum sp.]